VIQLEGDGTTPANTGRLEASPPKRTYRKPEKDFYTCPFLNWPQAQDWFLRESIITAVLHHKTVITPLRNLAQHCKPFIPLLAAPAALLLSQGQAKAVLTYNIFESAGNVVVQTSGSINLTGATPTGRRQNCGANGVIASTAALVCSGPDFSAPSYRVTGPATFNGSALAYPASSVSGINTSLQGGSDSFVIDEAYVSSTPIASSATFNSTTLAGLGFTTTGLIGTWTLTGTSETIQLILGSPATATAAVPGPLPLLGAGVRWSGFPGQPLSLTSEAGHQP
jgi:hypothetical protein